MKAFELFFKSAEDKRSDVTSIDRAKTHSDFFSNPIFHVGLPCRKCHDKTSPLENFGVLLRWFRLGVKVRQEILGISDRILERSLSFGHVSWGITNV